MSLIKNVWYCLQYDITRNFWHFKDKCSEYHGIVLMFHHITDEDVAINESCKCGVEDFRRVLLSYIEQGYEFVSIEKALSMIQKSEPSRFVAVTFDDIPDSVYLNAYPILKELSIPFAIFVTVGFIDKDCYITKQHLLELCTDPLCTIGAHTMTHPMLRQVNNAKWEIKQSKKELESLIGMPVKYFAYPFGQYSSVSKEVRKAVADSGYKCAFCTIGSSLNNTSTRDPFFLPRFSPTPDKNAIGKYKFTTPRAIASLLFWPIRKLRALTKR